MNFLRFLFIVEKIIIFIIVIIFIPITIFVFSGKQIMVQPQLQNFYQGSLQTCYLKTQNWPSLSSRYRENYIEYTSATTYMFYFGLMPLLVHVFIVFFVDLCSRHNMRLTNSLLIINEVFIGIGIIIKGYYFNDTNDHINDQLTQINTQCLDKTSACYQTFQSHLNIFQGNDNITTSFSFFMIFLLVLQVLCLIIMLILNILMLQYYKTRDIEPASSHDYELQHF